MKKKQDSNLTVNQGRQKKSSHIDESVISNSSQGGESGTVFNPYISKVSELEKIHLKQVENIKGLRKELYAYLKKDQMPGNSERTNEMINLFEENDALLGFMERTAAERNEALGKALVMEQIADETKKRMVELKLEHNKKLEDIQKKLEIIETRFADLELVKPLPQNERYIVTSLNDQEQPQNIKEESYKLELGIEKLVKKLGGLETDIKELECLNKVLTANCEPGCVGENCSKLSNKSNRSLFYPSSNYMNSRSGEDSLDSKFVLSKVEDMIIDEEALKNAQLTARESPLEMKVLHFSKDSHKKKKKPNVPRLDLGMAKKIMTATVEKLMKNANMIEEKPKIPLNVPGPPQQEGNREYNIKAQIKIDKTTEQLKKLKEELNMRVYLKNESQAERDRIISKIDKLAALNGALIEKNKKYVEKWKNFYDDYKFYEKNYLDYINPGRLSLHKGKISQGWTARSCRSNGIFSSFSTKISSNRNYFSRVKSTGSPVIRMFTDETSSNFIELASEFKYNTAEELHKARRRERSNSGQANVLGPQSESLLNYDEHELRSDLMEDDDEEKLEQDEEIEENGKAAKSDIINFTEQDDEDPSFLTNGIFFNIKANTNPFSAKKTLPLQKESIFSLEDPDEHLIFRGGQYEVTAKENPFLSSEKQKKSKPRTKLLNLDVSMIVRIKGDEENSFSPSLILNWDEETPIKNKEKKQDLSAFFIED